MKRVALSVLSALTVGAVLTSFPAHNPSSPATHVSAVSSASTSVERDEMTMLRASRSRWAPFTVTKVPPKPKAKPIVIQRHYAAPTPVQASGSCGANWQATLNPDERWIDERESGLNPNSRNPSGAYGLGQLMPGTYRDLGIEPDANPCHQIAAQRAYMSERYHSWSQARAWWESHSWW